MKKEILKGVTMLALLVALALATAVVSANAQSTQVVSNIPFEFVVGDQTLPAGAYSVRPANAQANALMIQSKDGKNAAVRLSNPTEQRNNKRYARLIFHRYGQNYFLAEVWNGESTGRQLLKSKHERAIERELASIPSKSDLAQSTYETIEVVAVLR